MRLADFLSPREQASASRAGRHRTVDEVWFILAGCGEMWQCEGGREEVVSLHPDLRLTISVGTPFQFRTVGDSPLVSDRQYGAIRCSPQWRHPMFG